MRALLSRLVGNLAATAGAAAWLVCAWCLAWSPAAMMAAATAGACLVVLCLARGHVAAHRVAVCAACVAVVLLPLAMREHRDRASSLMGLARHEASVELEVVVTADPQVRAASGVAGAPRVVVPARATRLVRDGRGYPVGGRVLVVAQGTGWDALVPGQPLRASARLAPAVDAGPTGVVAFVRGSPTLVGRPPWWQRGAAEVRSSLREAVDGLPDGPRGLLPGLVDGDTSALDPVIRAHFRIAGMTHLVAVSGTNCSILVGAVLLALRRTRARPWQRALVAGVVLIAFVLVARPSPSVLRAAVMAAIALWALASGRRRDGLSALGVAVVALLVVDPLLARDPGFTMSVLATGALLTIAPPLAQALERRRVPAAVAAPLAVATAAHLVTAPIVAAISGRVSLVAVPANVLAEPVVAVTTIVGFLAAILAPVWLPAGVFFAHLADWPCRWLIAVADRFGGVAGATVPWPASASGALLLALLGAVAIVLAVRQRRARRFLVVAALVALLVQIPGRTLLTSWPPRDWLFVACDVGQGDGLVLNAGAGSAVVVDAGPDPVVMNRCLDDLGVRRVGLLVFSHLHLDHVGGVDGVLRSRAVDRVASGPSDEPASGLRLVDDVLQRRGLRLALLVPGTIADVGGVHLEVLAPRVPFRQTRSDPNNSSIVLRATVRGLRVLLDGDVEVEAQQAMVDGHLDVAADVLKVPHHGSAYFVPAFLGAVHASAAVISVGRHNDYGHPAPSLLAALGRLSIPVRRTDRDGDVAFAGRAGHVVAVARGAAASTLADGGARAPPPRSTSTVARGPAYGRRPDPSVPERPRPGVTASRRRVVSGRGDRMGPCPLVRSRSTSYPPRSHPSYWWWATRNSSSDGP